MNNDLNLNDIPLHIMDKANEICDFMQNLGYVNWELGGLCSRNHADKVRVYEGFFEFIKERGYERGIL
jgi:hypothetical protein